LKEALIDQRLRKGKKILLWCLTEPELLIRKGPVGALADLRSYNPLADDRHAAEAGTAAGAGIADRLILRS
jgi:hypothetical protein